MFQCCFFSSPNAEFAGPKYAVFQKIFRWKMSLTRNPPTRRPLPKQREWVGNPRDRRPPERHTTQITNAVAPPLPGAAKAAPPDAEAATGVLCRGFGAGAGAPLLRSQSCGCCRWYLILCRRPNLFAAPPHRRGCRGWGAGIQSSWPQPSLCGGRVWPRPSLRGGRGRTRQAGSGAFHPRPAHSVDVLSSSSRTTRISSVRMRVKCPGD